MGDEKMAALSVARTKLSAVSCNLQRTVVTNPIRRMRRYDIFCCTFLPAFWFHFLVFVCSVCHYWRRGTNSIHWKDRYRLRKGRSNPIIRESSPTYSLLKIGGAEEKHCGERKCYWRDHILVSACMPIDRPMSEAFARPTRYADRERGVYVIWARVGD